MHVFNLSNSLKDLTIYNCTFATLISHRYIVHTLRYTYTINSVGINYKLTKICHATASWLWIFSSFPLYHYLFLNMMKWYIGGSLISYNPLRQGTSNFIMVIRLRKLINKIWTSWQGTS